MNMPTREVEYTLIKILREKRKREVTTEWLLDREEEIVKSTVKREGDDFRWGLGGKG